jgi:hypothetical protein
MREWGCMGSQMGAQTGLQGSYWLSTRADFNYI